VRPERRASPLEFDMVQQLVNLIGAVMLCELLIELFYEAAPLAPLRRLLRIEDEFGYPLACGDDEGGRGCAWYSLLAGCGYCLSVWVGAMCGVLFGLHLFVIPWLPSFVVFLVNGLIVHRLSNAWHAVVRRLIDTEGRLRDRLGMLDDMSAGQGETASPQPDTESESEKHEATGDSESST